MDQVHLGTNYDSNAFGRYSRINVRPIPGPIGAEVECGDLLTLDSRAMEEIYRAWLDHLVLLFRGKILNDDELMRVGLYFGELEKSPPPPVDSVEKRVHPNISVISNVVENGVAIGSLGNDEAIWHTDMSNVPIPPKASILTALEVPPTGGETGFINMYEALESLPASLRQQIDGRTIYHDGTRNSAGVKRRAAISTSHPIVRTHADTMKNALYLGRRQDAVIDGLDPETSDNLLDQLWTHVTSRAPAWHHEWKVGDTIVWDNRCCVHHRNGFNGNMRRLMHRTQTVGTVPYHSPNAVPGPHPRSVSSRQSAIS